MAFIGKSKKMRTPGSQYEKTPRDLTYEDQFYSQITLVDIMHVVWETFDALSVLAIWIVGHWMKMPAYAHAVFLPPPNERSTVKISRLRIRRDHYICCRSTRAVSS